MPRVKLPSGKIVYVDKAIPDDQMDDFIKTMDGPDSKPAGITSSGPNTGILSEVSSLYNKAKDKVNEHPILRRFLTGEGKAGETSDLMKKSGLSGSELGPGIMEIPGVNAATKAIADKVDNPLGKFGVSVLGGTLSGGFDPRSVGTRKPNQSLISDVPLGPEDNIPARANSLVKSYRPPDRLALPPATNPPISGTPMIAGPVGGPGVVAPANVPPNVAAEVAGLKTGGIPASQASPINTAELAEAKRLASLKYGPAAQNPGTSMDVGRVGPYDPNSLPLQSGNTTGGFVPESSGPLGYPLDIVPNRLRPRAVQTNTLEGLPMDLNTAGPKEPITFEPGPVGPPEQLPPVNAMPNVLPDLPSAPIKMKANQPKVAPPTATVPSGVAPNAPNAIPPTTVPPVVPPKASIVPPNVAANATKTAPFMDRLADWVNHRSWSGVAAFKNKQTFAGLDNGRQGILDFQANPTAPKYAALSNYFAGKRAALFNAGFNFGTKGESYLPQLWDNTPQQIEAVYGARLGTKPSFTMKSVIDDYAEGIAKGLKPKYENLSDLAGWYEKTAEKGIADKTFWESMRANGEIATKKSDTHPIALDPNQVPVIMRKEGNVNYYTTPEIAEKIGNVLGKPWKPLETASNVVSATKGTAMSVGVPLTGVNPHGFSTMVRGALASKGMIPGMLSTARDMLRPSHAVDTIQTALSDGTLERAMKDGLTLGSKAWRFQDPNAEVGIFSKIADKASAAFKKPLFDKVIPAAKINQYRDTVKELVNSGMAPDKASKQAANFANIVFDGKNTKALGENPNFGAALRTFFFAPGYGRSNIDIATETTKALLDPSNPAGKPFRRMAMNLTSMYVTANLVNKQMTGHWMFENDPQHSFDIATGVKDNKGKDQYIRVFGSAADIPRMTSEIATGLAAGQGDIVSQVIRNRLSPGTRLADQVLIQNENWKGDKLLGADKYGRKQSVGKQIGNVGSTLADNILPNSTRALEGYLDNSMSTEKAATQALGLPISYASQPPSPRFGMVPRPVQIRR